MSNSTTIRSDISSEDDDDLSDTEWIVIVLVLVIVLIVLIITIAKCLEIGKDSEKSLIENDFQSMRSGKSTVRSAASSKSRAKSLKKMPLNAEITRFSAGRVSRSAEYGVVIKDIGKSVNTDGTSSPPPPHYQHSNTMQSEPRYVQQPAAQEIRYVQEEPRYVQQSAIEEPRYVQQPMRNGTLTSPPNASVVVDRQYATTGTLGPDSRAVFVAPEGPYLYDTPGRTLPSQAPVPMQIVDMGQTYQIVGQPRMPTQPVILMQ